MQPLHLVGKNVFNLSGSVTGQNIPVISSRGMTFSCWEPSEEELKGLNEKKPVWLIQRGGYIPEMTMIVGDQEMVVPRDVRHEMIVGPEPEPEKIKDMLEERKWITKWSLRISRIIIVLASTVLIYLVYKLGTWLRI